MKIVYIIEKEISNKEIEEHTELITDYLKVEWESVKFNKGMYYVECIYEFRYSNLL